MTTKAQKIATLKAEYPIIKIGSEEMGYTELDSIAYEAKIAEWADNIMAKEAQEAQEAAAKQALLDKLGITADEAKLLLS